MCTSIVEIALVEGMAKREDEWFPLTHAVIAYDHARHALLDDAITIDFIHEKLPPGARAGVELTLESAKALQAALATAIAEAEADEAERTEELRRQAEARASRVHARKPELAGA
jgi:polysaccharide pyruvyl transferase WcaK-like protein